jgi:hypothetical protein
MSPQGYPAQGAYGMRQPPHRLQPGSYGARGYQGYGRARGFTNQANQIETTCMLCVPVCAALTCCCLCFQ